MAVMPSDHVISPDAAFQQAIAQAAALVEAVARADRHVWHSPDLRRPSRSATSSAAQPLEGNDAAATCITSSSFARSPRPISRGSIWPPARSIGTRASSCGRPPRFLRALEERQPEMMAHLKTIAAALGQSRVQADVFAREFAAIQGMSIDYAVMEHARDVLVIEAPFCLGRRGQLAGDCPLAGSRCRREHDFRKTSGAGHPRHDRARSSDDHLIVTLGVSDLHRGAHARRHAGGQQARRGVDSRAGQIDCRAGLAGVPLSMTLLDRRRFTKACVFGCQRVACDLGWPGLRTCQTNHPRPATSTP